MNTTDSSHLLSFIRGNTVEREHYGYITVTNQERAVLHCAGSSDAVYFLRSCAKPFQAVSLILTGAVKRFNINSEEIAVCCSSHSGTKAHTDAVLSLLAKSGLSQDMLLCGKHPPIDEETRNSMIKQDKPYTVLHNNCSGKHAAMLAASSAAGWNTHDYLDTEHPVQQQILNTIESLCFTSVTDIAADGCGAPVHAIPLKHMGYGFSNLYKEHPFILESMAQNPVLAGGLGRIDTSIMTASSGRLVSKLGAEGLCLVLNTDTQECLTVKILDSSIEARAITVIESLRQLEWLGPKEMESKEIQQLYKTQILTHTGQPAGRVNIHFNLK